jgi:hypothetical protein
MSYTTARATTTDRSLTRARGVCTLRSRSAQAVSGQTVETPGREATVIPSILAEPLLFLSRWFHRIFDRHRAP